MATIKVDIDIEDYLDEISDEALIDELNSRKVLPVKYKEYVFPEFKTTDQLIKFVKKAVGLKIYDDNQRLINEIRELISYT